MKKKLKVYFSFIALAAFIASCNQDTTLFDAQDVAQVTNPLGITPEKDFGWDNMRKIKVTVKVNDTYKGQYNYGVRIYDANTMLSETEATLLAQGNAKGNNSFSTELTLGKGQTVIYVQEITPTGVAHTLPYIVDETDATIDFAATETKATMKSPRKALDYNFPTIDDSKFETVAPSGLRTVGATGFGGVYLANKSGEINLWGYNNVLYIKGSCKPSKLYVGGNSIIYVTKGATLTLPGTDFDFGQPYYIYVANGGKVICNGRLLVSTARLFIQKGGKVQAKAIEVAGNSSIANAGELISTGRIGIENYESVIANYGTMKGGSLYVAGSGRFLNMDKTYITGLTKINSNSLTWNNYGYYETGTMTYQAGSNDVWNHCQLVVKDLLTISTSANFWNYNNAFFVQGDASVVTKNLFMENGFVVMGTNTIFKVTDTATFSYNPAGAGFQGEGSGYSLLQMNRAKAYRPYIHHTITYGGRLIVACPNHFGSNHNYRATDGSYHIIGHAIISQERGASITNDTTKTGLDIPATACNIGHVEKAEPKEQYYPQTVSYSGIYAIEDNWPGWGDYDLNDIVVKLDITGTGTSTSADNSDLSKINLTELTVKATYLATGADHTLGSFVQFDNISSSNIAKGDIESGQSKAVVMFDSDVATLMGGHYVNVGKLNKRSLAHYKSITKTLVLNKGIPATELAYGNINFFITINGIGQQRREVHLKGFKPTDLAAPITSNITDTDDPYSTSNNMVWGICIPGGATYQCPTERTNIISWNPQFKNWLKSGGKEDKLWYNYYRE